MNIFQKRIVRLANEEGLEGLTLREIGKRVGINHPQTVKNNILKLKRLGLLDKAHQNDFMKEVKGAHFNDDVLFEIPILGYANCGEARTLAEEDFQGYLTVSSSIVKKRPNLFVLIASGDSMDKSNIDGDSIEDGDYVIVDGNRQSPQNGDYVVSIIDGCANIKIFKKDHSRRIISLLSESKNNYPPIFIHERDFSSYFVNGTVIRIIKKPKIKD